MSDVWCIAVVTALAAVISPQGGERAAASTAPTFLATFLPYIGGSFDFVPLRSTSLRMTITHYALRITHYLASSL